MLLTLNINCLSCVRSAASSLFSSRTIFQLTERTQPLCQCIPFQPSEMRHTNVYFIRSVAPTPRYESSKLRNLLRKVHNMNGPTLRAGRHGFDLLVISNATDEWSKRLQVCVHVKGRLSEYLILMCSFGKN